MLLKEMIKENNEYKNKQPLELRGLKEFINNRFNSNFSSSAIRNILLNNASEDLGYFASYARGIYLPFTVQAEEEIIKWYLNIDSIYPIGRYLATRLRLSNQAFQNGAYIVFSDKPLVINHAKKLITKNSYYFVSNVSKNTQQKILMLIDLMMKVKFNMFIKYDKDIDLLMKWYENDYQDVLKTVDVKGIINNDEFLQKHTWNQFKEYTAHLTAIGTVVEKQPLPKPFDFNFIGTMKILKKIGDKIA